MAALHLIKNYCVPALIMLVKYGICRQQNIIVLMCGGIILLEVYLIVAGRKLQLAYSITAVVC